MNNDIKPEDKVLHIDMGSKFKHMASFYERPQGQDYDHRGDGNQ